MKIGFIGTGHIAKSTILGILKSNLKIEKIYISQRNKKISRLLRKKSKKIRIIINNQEIINKSNWVFLSITPTVGNKILKESKINYIEASTLEDAANKAVEALNKISN